MSSNESQLYLISLVFTVVVGGMVVVPTILGRRSVFSVWNLFLTGAVLFNGLSGMEAAGFDFALYNIQLGTADFQRYYVGLIVFYVATIVAYYTIKAPRRLAGRTMMHWPQVTPGVLLVISVLLLCLGALRFLPIQIPFVSQVILQLGNPAPIAAMALALIAWWRDKTNVVATVVLMIAVMFTLFISVAAGSGRRYLLSFLLTIPIVAEALYLRFKSPTYRLAWIAGMGAVCVPVLMGYTLVRHTFVGQEGVSAVERGVTLLKKLPEAIRKGGSSEGLTGQSSVQVGLIAINVCRTAPEKISPLPFFTILYMIENPIPRSIWPERTLGPKLESVGTTLPRNLGRWQYGYVNWGVNVVGQGYFDGGLHIHLLYGLIVGCLLRYGDEVIARKPGNPFIIAMLAVTCSQIIAWTRGSIEIFSYQIIAGVLLVLFISYFVRMLFGTGHTDARTDHIEDPMVAQQAATAWAWATQMNRRR